GAVCGASDAQAAYVKDRPVRPADLVATVYECLGIDPDMPVQERGSRPAIRTTCEQASRRSSPGGPVAYLSSPEYSEARTRTRETRPVLVEQKWCKGGVP